MTGTTPLVAAIALIGFGGLFAAIDAAVSTVSVARVEELVRDERPGAVRLARVMVERPRYINLVVLLRIICEITATVLLVVFLYDNFGIKWALFGAATTMVIGLVLHSGFRGDTHGWRGRLRAHGLGYCRGVRQGRIHHARPLGG